MSETDETKAAAIVAGWYWQMAEGRNLRWSHAVKSLTLFYESAPLSADVAKLVLEYLRSRDSVTELVVANKKWTFAASEGWRSKDAWYQTAPAERWNGTESTKVRVYWVLVAAGDAAADGPYTVENGCKYRVTHELYFDVSAAPVLPDSSSGVQYSIQGFTRDKETGLFTYIVERRETVQQTIALYASSATIFEERSQKEYLGVKADLVSSTGNHASASGGVIWQRQVSKNPDCTSDVRNVKIVEKKVDDARTVTAKRLRGTTTTALHRNITSGAVNSKTSAKMQGGETRTVEKTDGGLRTLQVEKFAPQTVTIEQQLTVSAGAITRQKTRQVKSSAVPTTVKTPEPNEEKVIVSRMNDDGQTADVTETTRQFKKASATGTSDSGGGVSVTTTERAINDPEPPVAELLAPEPNVVVETDANPNEHGSFTTTKRRTVYRERTGTGESNSGGSTLSVTERKINTLEAPVLDPPEPNVAQEIDVNPNEHGSFTTVKRKTRYSPRYGSGGSNSGDASTTTTTRTINDPTDSHMMMDVGQPNVVEETDSVPNDHGSFTKTHRRTVYHEKTATGKISSKAATTNVTRKINTLSTDDNESPDVNKTVEMDATPNDHGSFTTVKRVTKYTPISKTATSEFANETAKTIVTINDTRPSVSPGNNSTVTVTPNEHGSATITETSYTPIESDTGNITWQSAVDTPTMHLVYQNTLRVFKNKKLPPTPGFYCQHMSISINRYGLFDGTISGSKLQGWSSRS
jgi:hypothetical protein